MATNGLTASEQKLFELPTLALARLQDDEAVLTDLGQQHSDIGKRAITESQAIGLTATYLHTQLRDMGLAIQKREPYDDEGSIWLVLQKLHDRLG